MNRFTHICLLMLIIIATRCGNNEQNVVARVNNKPITKSELKHWMLLEKANVYNYFYQKYCVNDSDNFWTQKQGDEIPLEKLKNIALEKARRCKVQQIIALEKGIIKTANFDEIIGELEIVNAERKRKVENNEPIYGPVQFTSRTWFFHVFDKMVIQLKNELAKKELKPGSDELIRMKNNNSKATKDIAGFLTMQYVDKNYDSYINKRMSTTVVKLNKAVYNKINIE